MTTIQQEIDTGILKDVYQDILDAADPTIVPTTEEATAENNNLSPAIVKLMQDANLFHKLITESKTITKRNYYKRKFDKVKKQLQQRIMIEALRDIQNIKIEGAAA